MIDLDPFTITSAKHFRLDDYPSKYPHGFDDAQVEEKLDKVGRRAAQMQKILYAEGRTSLLSVFQGMDAAGKDGCIRVMLRGCDPAGIQVHSFKQPSALELRHGFLWRAYLVLPPRGITGVFNRSYYEEVLVSKVHPELVLKQRLPGVDKLADIDEDFWENRYRNIRNFEHTLHDTGTMVFKIFLNVSPDEQKKRLLDRIDETEKNWKFSSTDLYERQWWPEYHRAFEEAIRHTATEDAPWYVVPADEKQFARLVVTTIFYKHLTLTDPHIPELSKHERLELNHYRSELLREQEKKITY